MYKFLKLFLELEIAKRQKKKTKQKSKTNKKAPNFQPICFETKDESKKQFIKSKEFLLDMVKMGPH